MNDKDLQKFKKYSAPDVTYRFEYKGYKSGIIIEVFFTEVMKCEPHPRLVAVSELANLLGHDPHRFEKVFGITTI